MQGAAAARCRLPMRPSPCGAACGVSMQQCRMPRRRCTWHRHRDVAKHAMPHATKHDPYHAIPRATPLAALYAALHAGP
eukprot:365417-Chlamydomonas_euryale.AAC.24